LIFTLIRCHLTFKLRVFYLRQTNFDSLTGCPIWGLFIVNKLTKSVIDVMFLFVESHKSVPYPYSSQNFGCFWSRSVILRSTESEHPKLTSHVIIFEEFQPTGSRYLNVTDVQTDRRLVIA